MYVSIVDERGVMDLLFETHTGHHYLYVFYLNYCGSQDELDCPGYTGCRLYQAGLDVGFYMKHDLSTISFSTNARHRNRHPPRHQMNRLRLSIHEG